MLLLHLLLLAPPLVLGSEAEMMQPGEPASTSSAPPLVAFPTLNNNQTAPATMAMTMMPEAKRVPDGAMWSPSPPDLSPMMMHHQSPMPQSPPPQSMSQPQAVYPVAQSPQPQPQPPQQQQQPMYQPQPQQQQQQQQPFVPANYYLPGDDFPSNQYGPPVSSSNEYRSEHYGSYPPFEQPQPSFSQPSFPLQPQPQQLDTSLIPTAKHFVLVSFIGLLLLFAIIQNSITAVRRKDALVEVLSNRRKRDIVALTNLERMTPEVESALKEDARIRCIQRTLCDENRKLHQDLGIAGKLLAKYLTRNVQSSLRDLSPGWDRLVEDAANAGLRGEDCDVLYRDCSPEISSETETIEENEE